MGWTGTSRSLNCGEGSGEKVMDSRDASLQQIGLGDQADLGSEAEGRWQGRQSPCGRLAATDRQRAAPHKPSP